MAADSNEQPAKHQYGRSKDHTESGYFAGVIVKIIKPEDKFARFESQIISTTPLYHTS